MQTFSPHSPTPDEFAELVAESLLHRGSAGKLLFDRQGFALLVKDALGRPNKQIFLSNFYREYCSRDVKNREKVLLRASNNSSAGAWHLGAVQSRLLPQVKDRWSVEKMRLEQTCGMAGKAVPQPSIDGTVLAERSAELQSTQNAIDFPHGVIAEHFASLLTIDMPESAIYLTSEHLARASMTFQQAVDKAVQNLAVRTKFQFESLSHADTDEVILHSTTWKDEYDAARILFSHNIEKLPVKGDHLVFLVNQNYMLVTGTESERGLMYAYSELRAAQSAARAFPPFPILLRDGEYSRYRVPKTSLWHNFFREMELRYQSNVCRWQKDLLEKQFNQLVIGSHVVDFELAKNNQGKMFSYCAVYEKAIPALLPETDIVYFQNKNGRAASCKFGRLKKMLPDLFEETEFYPSRSLMVRFPTAAQLAQIGFEDPTD